MGFEENSQFEETEDERNERLRTARHQRALNNLRELIIDLASSLTDEGPDWSQEGLNNLRRRTASALRDKCPEWLQQYRDPE